MFQSWEFVVCVIYTRCNYRYLFFLFFSLPFINVVLWSHILANPNSRYTNSLFFLCYKLCCSLYVVPWCWIGIERDDPSTYYKLIRVATNMSKYDCPVIGHHHETGIERREYRSAQNFIKRRLHERVLQKFRGKTLKNTFCFLVCVYHDC